MHIIGRPGMWHGCMGNQSENGVEPFSRGTARPVRRGTSPARLCCFSAYFTLLAAIVMANQAGPEQWWPFALNLYLPQGIWIVPGALMALNDVKRRPLSALCAAGAILFVAGPLMGFCWSHSHPLKSSLSARVRVMTYNIKWGRRDISVIAGQIEQSHPDLILMQDANGGQELTAALRFILSGWHWIADGQYVVASRWPITDLGERSLDFPGGHFTYLRCRTKLAGRTITLYDVHLFTPRGGLQALRSDWRDGIPRFQSNVAGRLHQAALVAAGSKSEAGPLIVAGDLNSPVQSLSCRILARSGLTDAFSASGRGYGYTYGGFPTKNSAFLRIDHIYTSRQWIPLQCWTGASEGSEHRPVIADLGLLGS